MSLHTTPALLLRAHPYSETSRILRFLTPAHGVVALLARGVRARTGRGAGALETFARGELTADFRPDRDLQGFRDFRPGGGDPRRLGRDLLAFAAASYLAELVLAHAMEEAGPDLYDAFVAALEALESAPADLLPFHALAGGWQLLALFGFPPELEACVACQGPVDAEAAALRFDLEAGGLRCARCLGQEAGAEPRKGSRVGPRIGPRALEALRTFVRGEAPGPVEGATRQFSLLDRFALLHLGMNRPFRAEALVRAALEAREAPLQQPPASTGNDPVTEGA